MRVIRTYYARMLHVNDEYKYASGCVAPVIGKYMIPLELKLKNNNHVLARIKKLKFYSIKIWLLPGDTHNLPGDSPNNQSPG